KCVTVQMRLPCGIITFFVHKVTLPVQIFDQKRGGESGTCEAKKIRDTNNNIGRLL
ncbi:hypothetical protein HMPREF1989_00204, partial [Porphyromonas gingivalis F0566]